VVTNTDPQPRAKSTSKARTARRIGGTHEYFERHGRCPREPNAHQHQQRRNWPPHDMQIANSIMYSGQRGGADPLPLLPFLCRRPAVTFLLPGNQQKHFKSMDIAGSNLSLGS